MPTPLHLKHATAAFDLQTADGEGQIEGVASAFHVVDSDDDVIMPGAFEKSLKERGDKPFPLLWQHDSKEPVGTFRANENQTGLMLRGNLLVKDVAKAREARALAQAGALGGLSVGFMIKRAEPRSESNRGGLNIYEVDLWETSLVTFPANPAAQISAVKSALADGELPTVRDFERMLTRDAGFTRSQALTIIKSGFDSLATRDAGDDDEEYTAISEALKSAITVLRSHRDE